LIIFLVIGAFALIGFLLQISTDFAAFYLPGYKNRYSCLGCEYYAGFDLATIILNILFFIFILLIAINKIKKFLPENFIKKDKEIPIIIICSILIVFLTISGLIAFGIDYGDYKWWPETSFYSSIISGIVIIFFAFFYQKSKNK